MNFFIQHGYGKSDKIETVSKGLAAVSGVIISPADEEVDTARGTVARTRAAGLLPLLDPQAYVYSIQDGSARCHHAHDLDLTSVHWSQDPRLVVTHVSKVQQANNRLGITDVLIAPTCMQGSFTDAWTGLALQYARTSINDWGPDQTIVSVAIEEGALSDWSAVEQWLDIVTTLDCRGFYLVVDRGSSAYPPAPWHPDRLTNLLRMIYVLGVLNDYEVIWGYSDLDGLLGLTVGATASASGWYYSLRNFSRSKWQPSTGQARPAVARILLPRLWAPLRAEDEAANVFETSVRDEVFSARLVTRFASQPFGSWSRTEAQTAHMRALARAGAIVVNAGKVPDRCATALDKLTRAKALLAAIAAEGVQLPAAYRGRVNSYIDALEGFRRAENL